MPGTFFNGKDGSATVAGQLLPTSKWRVGTNRDNHDTTVMQGSANDALAWRDFIAGYKGGEVEMEGPYDPSVGLPYNSATATYVLLIGSTYQVSGTMAIGPIDITHDVNNACRWSL